MHDYDGDVLADPDRHRRPVPTVELRRGLVLEVADDGWVGEVVTVRGGQVVLRDRRGRERGFDLDGLFYLDDRAVRVRVPQAPPPAASQPSATRSGSVAIDHAPRVAREARIWVEGIHDAELIELVWGDDLRAEGVVVEPLGGVDDLEALVADFAPGPERRLGILVDHYVPGTKEHRLGQRVAGPDVLVTGHPFVDVWAAVKPHVAGLEKWPDVPLGTPWKVGVCQAIGAADPAAFWRSLIARVQRYTDLDRSLVGAVETLIDFVTEGSP